jgi:DNA-directed RNA polymerase
MTTNHLYLEQQELEIQAVQHGIDKYMVSRTQNQASANGPELRYIRRGMEVLTPVLDELKQRVAGGESIKGMTYWGIPLLVVDSDRLALITLSSIYNMSGHTNTAIFKSIADRVLLQIVYETLKHHEKGLVSWIDNHYEDGARGHSITILRKKAKEYTKTRWSKRESMYVGSLFGGLALKHCDEIEQCKVYTSNHQVAHGMEVNKDVREAIEAAHSDMAVLSPAYLPMICPPLDWTSVWSGGYLMGNDKFSCISPLVKESSRREDDDERINRLGLHLPAINHLQQTRWASNMYIVDLCEEIDINEAQVGQALGTIPLDLPNRAHVDWDDPDSKGAWCMEARTIHEHNRRSVGKRTLFYQLKATAKKLDRKYKQYYFAWQMDFRGRFYPHFCGMDPQGDKLNKAYLKFAQPQPLGKDGMHSLTIHLANAMGFDKQDLPTRKRMVHDNEDRIRAWVRDPLSNPEWTEEDGPYLLAAAEEWCRANDSDNPEAFLSHIPVAIDGKCNGLQHLSALARDPVGAHATCLSPDDIPQDIYMMVKGKVDEHIKDTITQANYDQLSSELPPKIQEGDAVCLSVEDRIKRKREQDFYAALNWRDKTSRKLVKRGAMTWAYGVTRQGIMDQLISDGFLKDIEGNLKVNAAYMRDAIYWGVNNVVVSAREVMEWLQSIAKIAAQDGRALRWTNPAGMVITQEYLKQDRYFIETVTGRFSFSGSKKNKELLQRKQINGIAPNFVHSIDSAHMANVVLRLKDEGVQDMHMVHDSYAVHACHTPLLHRVVREEFVKIHERNLLQEFKDEVEDDLGIELPPYPEQGEWDVREVLRSPYAFT